MHKSILFILAILFGVFAYFQWNDSDGVKWLLYYLLIAVLSLVTAFERQRIVYIILMMSLTAIWMITLLPDFIHWLQEGMPSVTGSMKAESPFIELVREFLGLAIALVALVYMWLVSRKSSSEAQ